MRPNLYLMQNLHDKKSENTINAVHIASARIIIIYIFFFFVKI